MLKRLFGKSSKTHRVHVEPFDVTLTVDSRETILQAALKAGLAYPYECQVGACTSCKSLLVAGDIKRLTDFAYVLDMEEIKAGYILACQSLARSDLTVRVTSVDDGVKVIAARPIAGKVTQVSRLTRDILYVRIALDDAIDYYAGQYANLHVPGVEGARSYSFACAPAVGGTTDVSFHVRLIPGGAVSNWLANDEPVGAAVRVDGPYGTFRLRASDAPILCVAGSSGMAPIKAMLEHAGRTGVTRPLVYLFGARTQSDLYAEALVQTLARQWDGAFRFVPVLSAEPAGSDWRGARGLVTDFIEQLSDISLADCHAYLCGPPAMIDAAIPLLTCAGIDRRDIHFDKFTDSGPTVRH